ncbi:hypothetical protein PXW68_11625 [Klebsiella quasipneumoniae subsp. similipneumoniae]|uniref:hypothetical protein n=1 Tax=Klebsiella quasipneumoniae TaxID=1463165 RepID=UPI00237FE5FA|nr:hypothetical protein [Klebsiella quasipneumoniae]MDE4779682.1 hypothetical protein [Klebsiella quasipneumoniae subsp. similipneumoniae]
MTITLQAVNELIASLESAGEPSIREQKFLKLAKAFKQLAAENVALKNPDNWLSLSEYGDKAAEVASGNGASEDEALRVGLIAIINRIETPATDRIVDEAEARGVEKAIVHLEKKFSNIGVQIMNLQWLADSLREGADK